MSSTALERSELDTWLDDRVGPRASLCPGRDSPTPFNVIWKALQVDSTHLRAIQETMWSVLEAIVEHYPDNVFWDLDRVVYELTLRGSADEVRVTGAKLVQLMAGFGVHSPICFRYVHDFTYGFDWAKWVARDPKPRAHVGPFDEVFLDYLGVRQGELLKLIAQDDETYGRLTPGELRNPFGFSREPDAERQLHESLASADGVPVETWEFQGRSRWGEVFARAREERAREMGLTTA